CISTPSSPSQIYTLSLHDALPIYTDLNGHRIDETRTESAFLLLQQGNPSGGITNFFLTFPPRTTPLFLDYEEFHPRPPKSGKNVVFMDGHVAPLEATRDDSE